MIDIRYNFPDPACTVEVSCINMWTQFDYYCKEISFFLSGFPNTSMYKKGLLRVEDVISGPVCGGCF